ncbi:MAG: DUF4349 domain-containing protein [Dehalococcoidia bacterium]
MTVNPPANLPARRHMSRMGRRLGLMLTLIGLAFSVAACGAIGSNDDTASMTTSSAGEGGATMGGFAGVAPAPSPPDMMPSAGGMDGSVESRGSVAPQVAPREESAPGLSNTLGRVVIRNGQIELVVESVEDSFQQVRQITESTGGYVSGSTLTGRGETQHAYLTLRVPAEEFDRVVERLRGLAIEVHSASTGSQDVTEEYADLEARLRNQRAVEEQYLTLLREASEIGEILEVQDRLASTRYEIERVQGRLNLLDSLTSLATLEVSLRPESEEMSGPKDPSFGDRVSDAWDDSLAALASIGTGIVLAVVWGWWVAVLGIVVALVALRLYRRRDSTPSPSGQLRPQDAGERVDTPDAEA